MSELTKTGTKFTVTYDLAFTKNMGNFQSLKVNVGLSQEGFGNKADIDLVMGRTRKWVEDNLGTAVSEVVAELEGSAD